MNYIIPVLILFILLNTALKISFWRWWKALVFAAVAGGFVLLAGPYAADQSKTELASWMQNTDIMQNVAVLITLESVLFFGFAFLRLRTVFGAPVKRYAMHLLNAYPGLLLYPALFYLLANLFFALPGIGFDGVARTLAISVFVGLPLLSWALSKLVPEEELRLEILFIVNLFVCITGLITTVDGETAYAAVEQPLEMKMLLPALGIFIALFTGGFLRARYRKPKIN